MNKQQISIENVVSQPFGENTYIVWIEGETRCVVVDPGFEPQKIQARLQAFKLTPVANLNTHGHSDHIAGNAFIRAEYPDCPLIIGHADADKLTDPTKNLSANYGIALTSPPADQTVGEGDLIEFAGLKFHTLETPGHSCGHVVFVLKDCDPTIVFGGDVLFQQSIGRTDFPDGNHPQLLNSIRTKLFTLPDDTRILPGHGPETTVGFERVHNPFLS